MMEMFTDHLIYNLRKLWEEHVTWTRFFIVSAVSDLSDLDLVTNRLLRNPVDFANLLSQYYGDKKSDEFGELLRQHLMIAADLVKAAKIGNSRGVEDIRRKWYANADEISAFLAKINPYWNENEWKNMLYDHLRLTEEEVVKRLGKNFATDIANYKEIEDQALKMADAMAKGIINHQYI